MRLTWRRKFFLLYQSTSRHRWCSPLCQRQTVTVFYLNQFESMAIQGRGEWGSRSERGMVREEDDMRRGKLQPSIFSLVVTPLHRVDTQLGQTCGRAVWIAWAGLLGHLAWVLVVLASVTHRGRTNWAGPQQIPLVCSATGKNTEKKVLQRNRTADLSVTRSC